MVKQSSIPVTSGAGGTQTSLIQTAVDYQSYEAGITLNITPHISQGDLLRLEIQLTRSDFRTTENQEKPPDKTASELKTTVFVPDASTIILGGLLKLNQNKGGSKVPLLGRYPAARGFIPQHQQPRFAKQAVRLRQDRDHSAGRARGRWQRGSQGPLREEPPSLRETRTRSSRSTKAGPASNPSRSSQPRFLRPISLSAEAVHEVLNPTLKRRHLKHGAPVHRPGANPARPTR